MCSHICSITSVASQDIVLRDVHKISSHPFISISKMWQSSSSELAVPPKCSKDGGMYRCFQCNPPPWLNELSAQIPECHQPIHMASPCVGLDAGYRASLAVGMPYKPLCVYDKELGLWDGLKNLYPFDVKDADADVHIGILSGDVTRYDLDTMFSFQDGGKKIDALFSGPPCPPVSSIGKRAIEQDSRAAVFHKVMAMICKLIACNPDFAFFVLENPLGIEQRKRDHDHSMADAVMKELNHEINVVMQKGWDIELRRRDLQAAGAPMARPRSFIIGCSPKMTRTPQQRDFLATCLNNKTKTATNKHWLRPMWSVH